MNDDNKIEIPRNDYPSCDFLKHNINAEKEAIEAYTKESSRTDDMFLKKSFESIAVEEMKHLEMLESGFKKLKCK